MTESTIQDANELSNRSPINRMEVTVKKAFEPQEGEGQYGPWKIQAAILKDETGEIRASFWNRFNLDIRNLEGEDLVIISGKDGKDKFSGITTDDYKGKRQLKISENATFDYITGEASDFENKESEKKPDAEVETKVSAKRFVTEETKRKSIEKQQALESAVAFCDGLDRTSEDVVTTAEVFYKFLHGEPEVI